MIQTIFVIVLFLAAVGYLVWTVRKMFMAKEGCPKGCGCGAVDIEKIEKEMTTKKSS